MGRRVLQLSEVSRKLETLSEQVLPFLPVDPSAQIEEKDRKGEHTETKTSSTGKITAALPPPAHQSSIWNPSGQPVPPSDRLANFYRKYNKVLLDNIAIEKERNRLATENAQLADLLQQYTEGTQLTEATLLDDNPLFVVNGRYPPPPPLACHRYPICCNPC